jgi:neutral ceramidase
MLWKRYEIGAGAAREEITPPIGTPLTGFIARLGVSTAVADHLFTRALVVANSNTELLIVQFDLLALSAWHVDEIRRACQRLLGIPPHQVLISCTHTHSGPGLVGLRGCLVADLEYQWTVVNKAVVAIQRAYEQRAIATMRVSRVSFRLGMNRRQRTAHGVVLGTNPRGPAPKTLDVAHFEMKGGTSCILFSHAAHPYVIGGDQTVISGDFPSFACCELEKERGTTAMFLNGCAGDVAPMQAFKGVEAARDEGRRIADTIRGALGNSRQSEVSGLRAASSRVHLPYAPLPSLRELQSLRSDSETTVRSGERKQREVSRKLRVAFNDWADCLARVIENKAPIEPVFAEVQALRIGDLTLIGISGEPFFATATRISKGSPAAHTWVLGYCNAYTGYLPTPHAFAEGGYEVSDAFRYLGIWRFRTDCSNRAVEGARKLIEELHEREP